LYEESDMKRKSLGAKRQSEFKASQSSYHPIDYVINRNLMDKINKKESVMETGRATYLEIGRWWWAMSE